MLTNLDLRRYIRPFFLDPKTSQPTSYKIYYDIASYVTTQLAFTFATAPFVLLTLSSSFLVWSRVYFYAIIGTGLATAFFASPAKAYLIKKASQRAGAPRNKLSRTASQESVTGKEPILGLPPNPEGDFEEIIQEVRAEFEGKK
jgi:lysophospholipid acyltransferase